MALSKKKTKTKTLAKRTKTRTSLAAKSKTIRKTTGASSRTTRTPRHNVKRERRFLDGSVFQSANNTSSLAKLDDGNNDGLTAPATRGIQTRSYAGTPYAAPSSSLVSLTPSPTTYFTPDVGYPTTPYPVYAPQTGRSVPLGSAKPASSVARSPASSIGTYPRTPAAVPFGSVTPSSVRVLRSPIASAPVTVASGALPPKKEMPRFPSGKLFTYEDRSILSSALETGVAGSNPCDAKRWLSDVHVSSKKGSSSDTVLLFAKLLYEMIKIDPATGRQRSDLPAAELKYWEKRLHTADDLVVIKVSFASKRPDIDNSLVVEYKVYQRFVNRLLELHCTPNAMLMVAFYRCDDFASSLAKWPSHIRKPVSQQIKEIRAEQGAKYDYNVVNMLVLERGRGMPFYEWVHAHGKSSPSAADRELWFSVLFQIFYTLECFAESGFRHNDLHPGNIWVETPVASQKFVYFLSPSAYLVVPVRAVVKIFDFDRAFAWFPSVDPLTGTEDEMLYNTALDSGQLCKLYGQCNSANEKNDAFNVLYKLYNQASFIDPASVSPVRPAKVVRNPDLPVFLKSWIEDWFYGDTKLLDALYPYGQGNFCRTSTPLNCGPQTRSPTVDEPTDEEMKPMLDVLFSGFKMFQRALPQYDPDYLPDVFPNVFRLPYILTDPQLDAEWTRNMQRDKIVQIKF